ncbi:MAG: histidine phosphatase family protein [Flavobacteriaceae bacterium]|nr:histidine phosphatase family protein [Flavobacteriaceae bacterium]
MKKYFFLLSLLIIICSSYAQENTTSTYYLIRHAEKDRSDTTNKNPSLTENGQQRAEKWSQLFEQFQIDAVYSTNYKRTQNTALPTAKKNNLTIKTYHPFKIDMKQFLKDTKGTSVLIVGHSNTTPSFVNKLIGKEVYKDIDDTNNANLYIVTIKGEQISHVLVKIK